MPTRSLTETIQFNTIGQSAVFSRNAASLTSVGGSAGPRGETPQQRITRLREAAKKARAEKVPLGDKLYYHGRIWADKAHRFVALGLIGATVVCGIATIVTFTEIIVHNRRLKKQYAEETKRILALETGQRQETEKVTPEELEKRKGFVASVKSWAVKGLTPANQEYKTRFDKEGEADATMDDIQGRWQPAKEGRIVEQVTEAPEPEMVEKRMEKVGGDKQSRGVTASILSWFGR